MKKLSTFILVLISFLGYAQHTVSTILNSPIMNVDDALALDSKGNLYGSNFGNYDGTTVYKITPDGNASPFVTGLRSPNGLAFDSEDNLFVVEFLGAAIHKYDTSGNLVRTYEVGGYPSGLIKDFNSDDMIFTNTLDSSINKLSQETGEITQIHVGAPLVVPVGLAFDKSGKLFIGNFVGRQIHKLESDGTLSYVATVPDSGTGFPFLAFIAYANGRIFATVYSENKIFKVHPNEIDNVEVYSGSTFGNDDGDISEATYAFPSGIIADKSGKNLYISQFDGFGNIRKITKGKSELVPKSFELKVFPNPVSDSFKIEGLIPNKGNLNIKVYNIFGKIVYERNEEGGNQKVIEEIKTQKWKKGMYQVVIQNDKGKVTKKIIVE